MESKKIKEVVDGLLEDEAEIMTGLLALRKPQQLDPFAERAQGRPFCPACGVAMSKNGKFFRINLKGTKPPDMPRKSKERGTPAPKDEPQVVALWAIDENDNMVAKIAGLGQEYRAKADKMLPHLKGCRTLVTDDRSCYEGFARDNGFKHIQIKSSGDANETGETMNEVNSLMSDFDVWPANCRGIATKHLQGYIDRFLFQKMLRYTKEALDRPGPRWTR